MKHIGHKEGCNNSKCRGKCSNSNSGEPASVVNSVVSAPSGLHPSHVTRFSDSSMYDERCVNCGATDQVPGGWGRLAEPCPKAR